MIRKVLYIFCVLLYCLSIPVFSGAEGKYDSFLLHAPDDHMNILDVAVSADHIAVLTGAEVYILNTSFEKESSVLLPSGCSPSIVLLDGESVWVYDEMTRIFSQYDKDGNITRALSPLPEAAADVYSAAVLDGVLLVASYPEHSSFNALKIDILSDAVEPIELENVWGITTIDDSHALIWSATYEGNILSILNCENNTLKADYIWTGHMLDELTMDDTYIYWIGNDGFTVYRSLYDGTQTEAMAVFPSSASRKLYEFNESILIWDRSSCGLYRISKTSYADEKVLKVAGESLDTLATARFMQDAPGYRVEAEPNLQYTAEQYLLMMMSQDSSIDIFCLSSDYSGTRQLIEKGFYSNLYQSSLIVEDTKTWYPRLLELCSQNEKLFGYPIEYFGFALTINDKQNPMNAEFSTKNGMTWADFFAYVESQSPSDVPLFQANAHLYSMILESQFLSGGSIEKERIGEYLAALSYQGDNALITTSWEQLDLVPESIRFSYIEEMSEKSHIEPLPSLTGKSEVPVTMWWMVINPYSTQIDIAEKYIEAHVATRRESDSSYTLIDEGQLAKLQALNDEQTGELYESLKPYDALMQYLTIKWASPLDESFYSLIDAYEQGEIATEEAIDMLYNRLMILDMEQGIVTEK